MKEIIIKRLGCSQERVLPGGIFKTEKEELFDGGF